MRRQPAVRAYRLDREWPIYAHLRARDGWLLWLR